MPAQAASNTRTRLISGLPGFEIMPMAGDADGLSRFEQIIPGIKLEPFRQDLQRNGC
jgi:hypothetical protein